MMNKSNESIIQNLHRDLVQYLTQWVNLVGSPNVNELESLRTDLYSILDMLLMVDNAAFKFGCDKLLSHFNDQLTQDLDKVINSTLHNYVENVSNIIRVKKWIDPFISKYDFQDLAKQLQKFKEIIILGEKNRIQQMRNDIAPSIEIVKDSFNVAVVKFGEMYSNEVDESIWRHQ